MKSYGAKRATQPLEDASELAEDVVVHVVGAAALREREQVAAEDNAERRQDRAQVRGHAPDRPWRPEVTYPSQAATPLCGR